MASSTDPLDRLMESAGSNLAGQALSAATQAAALDHPASGSMAMTARQTGRIICGQCQALNPGGAHFCGNCGTPLVPVTICPACQTRTPAGSHFCPQCGQPLPPSP